MENVTVYSPIEDKNIKNNLNGSPIWKNSIHPADIKSEQDKHVTIWEYSFKFEGLKPVQLTNVKRYK